MNYFKFNLLCILLSLFSHFSFSQNQNNNWYFGDYAGLTFTSGSPVAVTTGQLFTNEGCSTISDNTGSLLFYSDGQKVWNRLGIVMTNGTGLLGDPSTTQSALIVQQPGSTNIYYIFTIDDLGGSMRYSVVDMLLAGGFGDVTAAKNILLHSSVSEKQCAVQKCDGNYWIISHQSNNNTFYADLLTSSGIAPSVTSSIGSSHTGGSVPFANTVGQLKVSQQRNRLALAIRDAGFYEVFDFDEFTGIISNPLTIGAGYSVAYGVEFSPDGTKLYGGRIIASNVYQFNLLAGSAAAISASAIIVGSTSGFTNSFQIGLDGKIYIAKSISQTSGLGYLDVINTPNSLGAACSYTPAGLTLAGKLSLLGLPNFPVYATASSLNVTGSTAICLGQSTTLTANGGTTYTWTGGTTAFTNAITVSPVITTDYYVSSLTACGLISDTVTVTVDAAAENITASGSDSICSGQSVLLSASGGSSYVWSGGTSSTLSSVTVAPISTTNYFVSGAVNACGSDTDTLTIYVDNMPNINVTGTTNLCLGQSAVLTASGSSSYTWSGAVSATTSSISVSPLVASTYYVTSPTNLCGSDTDTINVSVDTLVNVYVSGLDSICVGQTTLLSASGSPSYVWFGGISSTLSSVTVSPLSTTYYYVSGIANACGLDIDTLVVYVDNFPNINVSGITNLCLGQSTVLTASGASSYTWSGAVSSATSSITVSPSVASTYYVTSPTNLCGSDTDTINVSVEMLVNINVSGIDSICSGQSTLLSASGSPSYLWSGGASATTSSITVSPTVTTNYYVSGLVNACGSDSDTLVVYVESAPNINVSGVTNICTGQSTTLTASGGSSYLWSGGSSSSSASIMVSPLLTTTYYVSSPGVLCAADIDTIVVTVSNFIPAQFSYTYNECNNQVVFQNLSPGAQSYYWNFGDGTFSSFASPSNNYSQGFYNVTFTTNPNTLCVDSISQIISVANSVQQNLLIPNVFTPNGDGVNDQFLISGLSYCKSYELMIFNRWGEEIFETTASSNIFWNGINDTNNESSEGIYFYIIRISDENNKSIDLTGFVNLLR